MIKKMTNFWTLAFSSIIWLWTTLCDTLLCLIVGGGGGGWESQIAFFEIFHPPKAFYYDPLKLRNFRESSTSSF